jgi:hypothetical protein
MKIDLKTKNSFWARVKKGELNECWNWRLVKNTWKGKWNYGVFSNNGVRIRAHRFSWILYFGPIPEEICVLHECDNPTCVNPFHLFLGTHKDNADDMVSKGRNNTNRGRKIPRRKK